MATEALNGDRVVVIGGSSGIGQATAARVIEANGEVIVASRGAEKRQETVAALGDAATGREVDLADGDAVDAFFEDVGAFDHLVLTAAHIPNGGFLEADADDVLRAFEVKGLGYFRAAKAAADSIHSDGSITMISAISAIEPSSDYFALGMANAAIETLMRSVAVEMGPVRANAISPSTVDTWGMDEERKREMASELPSGHVGEPADIADAVLFCMRNEYLTGEVLRIDGGDSLT